MRVMFAAAACVLIVACPATEPPSPASDAVSETLSDTSVDTASEVTAPDTPPTPDVVPDVTTPDPGPPDAQPDLPAPQDPQLCSGSTQAPLQSFGGSCCYTDDQHPDNPSCVWYAANYGEGECLDAQCDTNFCTSARYCTKGCTINSDAIDNATGEQVPDGIDDSPINDCFGAASGPFGHDYKCVNLRNPANGDPYGVCRPGTTFAACDSHDDCPQGEVCNVLYVLGEYGGRCTTAPVAGAGVGEACNSDPNSGPLQRCRGPFCFGYGCVELCSDDDNCATDTCDGGSCTKNGATCTTNADCSAWGCGPLTPYSNTPYTDDFCSPRSCNTIGDCRDPDFFCRPFWNGADTVEEVEFAPACRARPTDGTYASYGEPCGSEGDGTELPPCVWASGCIDNYCSGPCQSDADCGPDAECLVGDEWGIDVDDDDAVDSNLFIDLCMQWPHSGDLTDCTTDADCGAGEHCQWRLKGSGEGTDRSWEVEFKCRTDYDTQVGYGEVCNGPDGAVCKGGLCLVNNTIETGMCVEQCTGAMDCPQGFDFEGFTWNSICLSFTVGYGSSLGEEDDLMVSYCWRNSGDSSVTPCDANKACGPAEFCRAAVIAGNPDEPAVVEHLCLDASEGLAGTPNGQLGEPCDTWSECGGRSCYPDGAGGGYCTHLCTTDADCDAGATGPPLACTEVTLLPRLDPAHSAKTHRCIIQKTCLSCSSDEDCGGDWLCGNIGGFGAAAEYRCGASCSSDSDCLEAGTTCESDIDPEGQPTGRKLCLPGFCE